MTVSNTLAKAGPYLGNGVATSFGFTFKVFVKTDVKVVKTSTLGIESTLLLDSDYSVALNADQNATPGGTITYPLAGANLATGEKITLVSNVPDLQSTDITNASGFFPNVIEDMVDTRAIVSHQNAEAISRAVTLPVSVSPGVSSQLPSPIASNLIGWDPTGTFLQNFVGVASSLVSTFMATVNSAVTAAAARLTLGAAASGANTDITSILPSALTAKIQPIAASLATNALTVTLNQTILDFRSSTLGVGVPNTRIVANPISLTVPATATLGTTNGALARLIVLAIDNAGTVELAIVNNAGALLLDETGLISTTALSAGSTATNVVYSTTARASVPYRIVGYLELTQATAGTWVTAPSVMQGTGGRAFTPYRQLAQAQSTVTTASATGTTIIPLDNTIPQNNEGDQYMSATFTPKSSTSTLEIDVVITLSCNQNSAYLIASLFQDSTANALAIAALFMASATGMVTLNFKHFMTSGTTSPITFKVRGGNQVGGTTTFNGAAGVQQFGGSYESGITIKEYLP